MPAEKFWNSAAIEGDPPVIVIRWGDELPEVTINGDPIDRSGLNRAINALRRARDNTYGSDA